MVVSSDNLSSNPAEVCHFSAKIDAENNGNEKKRPLEKTFSLVVQINEACKGLKGFWKLSLGENFFSYLQNRNHKLFELASIEY